MTTKPIKPRDNLFNSKNPSYKCFLEEFGFPVDVIKNIFKMMKPDIPGYSRIKFHRKLRECQRVLIFGNGGKPDYPLFFEKNVQLVLRFYDCMIDTKVIQNSQMNEINMKTWLPYDESILEKSLESVSRKDFSIKSPDDVIGIFADNFEYTLENGYKTDILDIFQQLLKHETTKMIDKNNPENDALLNTIGEGFGYFRDTFPKFITYNSPFFLGLLGMTTFTTNARKRGVPGPKNWIFPSEEVDNSMGYSLPLSTTLPYYLFKNGISEDSKVPKDDYPISLCDSVIQLEKLITVRRKLKPLIVLSMVNTSFRKFIYTDNVMAKFWENALQIIHGTKLSSPSHFKYSNNPIYGSWNIKKEINKYKEFEKDFKENQDEKEIEKKISFVNDIAFATGSQNIFTSNVSLKNQKKGNNYVKKTDDNIVNDSETIETTLSETKTALKKREDYENRSIELSVKVSSPFSFFRSEDLISTDSDKSTKVTINNGNLGKRERIKYFVERALKRYGRLVPLPAQTLLLQTMHDFSDYMDSFISEGKITSGINISSNYKMKRNIVTDLYGFNESNAVDRLRISIQLFHDIEQSMTKMLHTDQNQSDSPSYAKKIQEVSTSSKISMVMTFLNFPIFINTIPPWIIEKLKLFGHFNLCNLFLEKNGLSDESYIKNMAKHPVGTNNPSHKNTCFSSLPNWVNFTDQLQNKQAFSRRPINSNAPITFIDEIRTMTKYSSFNFNSLRMNDMNSSTDLYKLATVYYQSVLIKGEIYYSYDTFKNKFFGNFFVKLLNYLNYHKNMQKFGTEIFINYVSNLKSLTSMFETTVKDQTIQKHVSELDSLETYFSGVSDIISCIEFFLSIFGYNQDQISPQAKKPTEGQKPSKSHPHDSNKEKENKNQKVFKKQTSFSSGQDKQEMELIKIEDHNPTKKRKKEIKELDFDNETSEEERRPKKKQKIEEKPSASKQKRTLTKTKTKTKQKSPELDSDNSDDEDVYQTTSSKKIQKEQPKPKRDDNKPSKKKNTTKKKPKLSLYYSGDNDNNEEHDAFGFDSEDLDKYSYHNSSSKLPISKSFI